MNKEKFIEYIFKLGFKKLEDEGWVEKFETDFKPENDGLTADGYDIKYILNYRTMGFHIYKISRGGLFETTDTKERIFSGVVDSEEELQTVFKCIGLK